MNGGRGDRKERRCYDDDLEARADVNDRRSTLVGRGEGFDAFMNSSDGTNVSEMGNDDEEEIGTAFVWIYLS